VIATVLNSCPGKNSIRQEIAFNASYGKQNSVFNPNSFIKADLEKKSRLAPGMLHF
jgi:hypothetical protein